MCLVLAGSFLVVHTTALSFVKPIKNQIRHPYSVFVNFAEANEPPDYIPTHQIQLPDRGENNNYLPN